MTKFSCQRCGACCKSLIIDLKGKYHIGLFLLPEETRLFPAELVLPFWAVGTKGRSRPGRPKPAIYQLNAKTCPHLTKTHTCRIYKRRPLVCRAFPLTIHADLQVTLDTVRCKTAQPLVGETAKLTDCFTKETIQANLTLHEILAKTFRDAGILCVYLYDVKKQTWHNMNLTDLQEIEA